MNTCDTCQHWERQKDYVAKWKNPPEVRVSGVCKKVDVSWFEPDVDGIQVDRGYSLGDESEYMSTGPKFGCIFHSPKP